MERSTWRSPRGSLELELDWMRGEVRGTLTIPDPDWREHALSAFQAVRALLSPALPASARGGRGPDSIDYLICHRFAPVSPVSQRPTMPIAAACDAGSHVADAIAICHGAAEPILVGPLVRELIWHPVETGVNTIVGAGLTRVALAYDAAVRGAAMTLRHFRSSPEQILGGSATVHTDVFYLAYLICELITGREPYPTDTELSYMRALTAGHAEVPPDAPREVAAALSPDPVARPSLRALRDALHAHARRAAREN